MASNGPFKVIPLPNLQFTNNSITVPSGTFNVDDTDKKYDLVGNYVVESSSFYDNLKMAFNAFNGTPTSYWKTNTIENDYEFSPATVAYTQTPYLKSAVPNSPSIYQGGGTLASNFFSTKLANPINSITKIDGEWIQIKLPTKFNLASYSILTPRSQNNMNYFPLEFTVAGSHTGTDGSWYVIDQETFGPSFRSGTGCCSTSTIPNITDSSPVVFTLNSNRDSYTYYRLIISKMPYGTDIVRISQWNLKGKPSTDVSITGNAVTGNIVSERFTLMNKEEIYFDLNPPLYTSTTFSISEPTFRMTDTYSNHQPLETYLSYNENEDYVLASILFTVLIGTALYTIIRSKY